MEYIYAALLLHKVNQPVNEENLKKVVGATGADVDESKVKALVASLKDVDIEKEIENASVALTAPQGVSGGAGERASKEEAKEEEKEEEKPSESAAGLASLFG